jgi:large subunit ribosomal protein L10
MSKYVKELVSRDIKNRLTGVSDAILITTTGMDANTTNELRGKLAEKSIQFMVVKNTLGGMATQGSSLAKAFEGASGQVAVCWGSSDFVSLAKEVVKLDKDSGKFDKFKATGGVLDGERLSAEQVLAASKWPTREEQISILVGQILSPGANLAGALLGPGGKLASQIETKGKEEA